MTARLLTPLAALAVLAITGTACEINLDAKTYTEREERQFAVTGRPTLDLRTFDGSIEVRSWDRSEVRATVEKAGDNELVLKDITTRFAQDGNRITVEATGPKRTGHIGIGRFVSPTARLQVLVPREADVTLFTGDGPVEIEGVSGRLEIKTGDGSITGDTLAGELRVSTDDGAVRLARITGAARVLTRDGSIRLSGVLSQVDVDTGDGSVEVEARDESRMAGNWRIVTGDGSVTLRLPQAFDADVDARTEDGRVHMTHAAFGGRGESREDRHHGSGRMGHGGHRLQVETGDGSISVLESR